MTHAAEISRLKDMGFTSGDNASKACAWQMPGDLHLGRRPNTDSLHIRALFNTDFPGASAEFKKPETSSSADADISRRENAPSPHPDTVAGQTKNPFNIIAVGESSSRMSYVLLCIFAPWTLIAASNAGAQCTTLGAEAAGSSPPFDADIGLGIGFPSMICAVAEAATVIYAVSEVLVDQVKASCDRQQNLRGYEDFNHGEKSVSPSKTDSPPASDPARDTPSFAINPKQLPSSASLDLEPLPPPMTVEQEQLLIKDASAYLRYEDAIGRSDALRWEWLKIGIVFIRDSALQLAGVANRAAITAKLLDSAVSVSANVAGVFASAFSIASSLFHTAAGIVDLIQAHLTRKRAVNAGNEMKECMNGNATVLDLNKLGMLADLDGKRKVNEAKAEKQRAAIKNVQNPQEVKDVEGIYSLISHHFLKNQSQEVSETKTVSRRAGARVLYGVLGASVAVAGLALSATGVGGVLVVGAVSAAGAVLGMLWLGFAVYKTYDRWKAGREKQEREGREKVDAIASSEEPLASAEREFLDSLQANGHIAATLLARHLAGGKRAASQEIQIALANAGMKPAQSSTETTETAYADQIKPPVDPIASRDSETTSKDSVGEVTVGFEAIDQMGHNGVPISAEGLTLRRKTATRFLLIAGMSRGQVRSLKTQMRDPSKAPEVLEEIERYLLGNAARQRSARPPKESKRLRQQLTAAIDQLPIPRTHPA